MARGGDDEEITFSASAFNVVGSWLLGGSTNKDGLKALAEKDTDRDATTGRQKAPVTLYRPSAGKAAESLTRPGAMTGAALSDGKVLTEQEREMKKKLLRKSGQYREKKAEEAGETAAETEALDREEEELVRYKQGHHSSNASKKTHAGVQSSTSSNTTQVAVSASTTAIATYPTGSTGGPSAVNKKRKVSAQDELLEKLREEAARKKAKNLKQKLKMQRKKEEKKAATTAAVAADPVAQS